MKKPHKNKTLATLLAFLTGGLGLHRFYLAGLFDRWGLAHAATVPLTGLLMAVFPDQPAMFTASPLILSGLIGFIEALVIGLTPDEKWDERYNAASGRRSHSGWPLAVLLVLTLGAGAVAVIATLARTFDLLYTGGAFG